MATDQERLERTERAFAREAARGHQWTTDQALAQEAMADAQSNSRAKRSIAANSVRDLLALDRQRSKPTFRFRHQTALALIHLKETGRLDSRFMDENGRLRSNPPMPRKAEDKRYRLRTEETQPSPQDRFEAMARRIESLPGATTEGEDGEEVTRVAVELDVPRNPTWPRPTSLALAVDYLPAGSARAPKDPASITAELAYPTAVGMDSAQKSLAFAEVYDGGHGAIRDLDILHDTVRLVELTHADAEQDMVRDLASRAIESMSVPRNLEVDALQPDTVELTLPTPNGNGAQPVLSPMTEQGQQRQMPGGQLM